MDRYDRANEDSPKVIYTDRDCCSYAEYTVLCYNELLLFELFSNESATGGCTSEFHLLYGILMSRVSSAISSGTDDYAIGTRTQ